MAVPGRRYHVIARFMDQDLEFIGIGAVGSELEYPVFRTTGLGTMTIPLESVQNLEPVEE